MSFCGAVNKENAMCCGFICGGLVVTGGVITMLVTGILGTMGSLPMNYVGAWVMLSISILLIVTAIATCVKNCRS